ncbi:hypothetical protein [Psychrobacter immobilis]|nr:hypothetical protein [Psychrobacter immobilis]
MRTLNKREVVTALTNQELIEYIERLQPTVKSDEPKRKRRLFGRHNVQ